MKKLLLLIPTLLILTFASAQSYNTALGFRLGTDWGVSWQQRILKKTTIETIVQSSFFREEALLTVLGEQHNPILGRRFNLYVGGGFHKGWLNQGENSEIKDPFGLTGVFGLEFTLARVNVSFDFKPAVNLVGGEKRIYSQSGFSVRYVLFKKKKYPYEKNKKKSWQFWKKS